MAAAYSDDDWSDGMLVRITRFGCSFRCCFALAASRQPCLNTIWVRTLLWAQRAQDDESDEDFGLEDDYSPAPKAKAAKGGGRKTAAKGGKAKQTASKSRLALAEVGSCLLYTSDAADE